MTGDSLLEDIPRTLGLGVAPLPFVRLHEADPALLEEAWPLAKQWTDSAFFEEAMVLAGVALEEVADDLPPPDDHVRFGGFGAPDLITCDRMVEAAVQSLPKSLLIFSALGGAIADKGFGSPNRSTARPLLPGICRFMCDPPRLADGAAERAIAAAAEAGVPAAADHLAVFTTWPAYLATVARGIGRITAGGRAEALKTACERVRDHAATAAATVAAPAPSLYEWSGPGGALVAAELETLGPVLVIAAWQRIGLPEVARIPRVA